VDLCADEDKATITSLKSKTAEELKEIEKTASDKLEKAQKGYDAAVEQLQKDYEKLTADLASNQEQIKKESNYKWVKQLVAASGSDGAADEL
jgi:Skp family chaperone for outer membrane proteins